MQWTNLIYSALQQNYFEINENRSVRKQKAILI